MMPMDDRASLEVVKKGLLTVVGLFTMKLLLEKGWAIMRMLNILSCLPCRQIILFHPIHAFALLLGSIYPGPGMLGSFYSKFSLYKKCGSTILPSILFWSATPVFWLADVEAIKVVTTERRVFQKELSVYEPVNFWGDSVVSTEGARWKRRRAVANPAFNEANTELVWSETNRLLAEWFALFQDGEDGEYHTLDLNPELMEFTLFVLISATFGHQSSLTSFKAPPPPDSQHTLSLYTSFSIVMHSVLLRHITPSLLVTVASKVPIPFISERVLKTEKAFEELRLYILQMISSARDSIATGLSDTMANSALLKNLVEANMKGDADHKSLSDEEILADVFIFLLAGHETSSHALAFALTLIAFFPEVQRKIYEETKSVWPNGPPAMGPSPVYKTDFSKLDKVYTQATFRETLRHYSVVPRIPKTVCEDTILTGLRFEPNTTPRSVEDAERFEVHILKGSLIVLDTHAIHMNPMHWGMDAREFKPEKFIDNETYRWPREAFLPFSAGARACIGMRFALSQSVAILANFVHTFEISLPSDVELKLKDMETRGVSVVERLEWLLAWSPGVTSTAHRAKVRVRRRQSGT